ncbi:MAG TPA: hypothetical protein PK718_04670 [Candidatus Methanofastidiosa archaeon]|nr:hypothetical protein [Candidatus Methanofastidiosa archaeon]
MAWRVLDRGGNAGTTDLAGEDVSYKVTGECTHEGLDGYFTSSA